LHLCSYMNTGSFMQRIYVLLFCLVGFISVAQVMETMPKDTIKLDSIPVVADPKYREDQFYATIDYNLMHGQPAGYKQYSFSTELGVGFLRDMPINKRRNHSIAIGAGYSYNNIKHNLKVDNTNPKGTTYATVDREEFDKNKLVLHYLEVPLELRWRNSDSISHKFWRVYAGFKASFLFSDKAQYEPAEGATVKLKNDANLNKILYSTYLAVGWNTWNFYASYGITPIYDTAITDEGEKIKMGSLKLGLIFYIL